MRLCIGMVVLAALVAASGVFPLPARAGEKPILKVYGAGTLAVPFRALDRRFEERHPDVTVEPVFGGSVMLARRITALDQHADVFGVADYHVIPKYLFNQDPAQRHASWYVGFAGNAITFAYTAKSRFAKDLTPENWYRVLARPGVEIGRSNPNTDPSGYQTLQMLALAAKYYQAPDLAAGVLRNAPLANMRDTEISLLSALQLGEIDYLAIYRSDAMQHRLDYIRLPAKIDLSDPADAAFYATGVADTKNGPLPGKPIVYAVTIPGNADQPALAAQYIALLLAPDGQAIMAHAGFRVINPAYGVDAGAMPAMIRSRVVPWPAW